MGTTSDETTGFAWGKSKEKSGKASESGGRKRLVVEEDAPAKKPRPGPGKGRPKVNMWLEGTKKDLNRQSGLLHACFGLHFSSKHFHFIIFFCNLFWGWKSPKSKQSLLSLLAPCPTQTSGSSLLSAALQRSLAEEKAKAGAFRVRWCGEEDVYLGQTERFLGVGGCYRRTSRNCGQWKFRFETSTRLTFPRGLRITGGLYIADDAQQFSFRRLAQGTTGTKRICTVIRK